MAILKAYLDDSGDAKDQQHNYLTIGGYVSDVAGWEYFERRWEAALVAANVPYLHMKKMGDPHGIYAHLHAKPNKLTEFIVSLVEAIYASTQLCPATTIKLADLAAFNKRHGLDLDPYALALYGALIEMRREFRNEHIEVVVDRFERSMSRFELALEYAKTDVEEDHKTQMFTPVALQDDQSFRNILPLQAADFVAWEIRKSCEDRKMWKYTQEQRADPTKLRESYAEWTLEYFTKHKKFPRERRSFLALRESPLLTPRGFMWDEPNLEAALRRHPRGWAEGH